MPDTQDNSTATTKPGFFKRMSRYFRDTRGEMKKVVWSTKKQALNNTVVVLIFLVFMAVLIGVLDGAMTGLISLLFGRGA